MKILLISSTYMGGIGGHVSTLAEQLRRYGHDVTMMQVPHIPIKNLKNPSFALFATIRSMLDRRRYDIAHAFNIPSAFPMRYANARKKILSVHGIFGDQVRMIHSRAVSSIASNAESRAMRMADMLATDSRYTQRAYGKLGFDFKYLPTAIDAGAFEGVQDAPKQERQVIYLGRDSFEKGIDVLRSLEPNIRGNVVYCTNLPWREAMRMLKASSVMVIPSRTESSPVVIKEAFFLKIPVVATDVGGVSELIEDQKTGILTDPADPAQLLDAIHRILDDPAMAGRITERAYELACGMTWDALLPRYVEMYEGLLSSQAPP